MEIKLCENGIHVVIAVTEEGDVRLLHLSGLPYEAGIAEEEQRWYRMFEVQETGANQNDHHGAKHTGTSPGCALRYVSHQQRRNQYGLLFCLTAADPQRLSATAYLQFYDGLQVVRAWTELANNGQATRTVEFVSSFTLTGIDRAGEGDWQHKLRIGIAHNTWQGECQWQESSPGELGLYHCFPFSLKRIAAHSTGSWPTSEYLPMGYVTNRAANHTLLWQIEAGGSWNWEISTMADHLYLTLSGPGWQENGWRKTLYPGEAFRSEPAALAFAGGGVEEANRQMTTYRRRIRRPNADNERCPVIFNDFMNCLMGDATTEKLLPLIDAAAEVGCEVFCIDAGWYADGAWWDGVGEWMPAKHRFSGGLKEVLEAIRSKGMTPGLWLELEVMGIRCPLAEQAPDDWFFCRGGKRVIDHGRYQLDFRNPAVIAHADAVVRRLVEDYGVGYIKMDYNINAGVGTELEANSAGDGLLAHTRAYQAWLAKVFTRYPGLVIEHCSSGGQRMTYAFLQQHSLMSVTDQESYLRTAPIAAACTTAVAPEQAAVWAMPMRDGDAEETIFNMVNALLLRVHQSGHLAELSEERRALVAEGIAVYKQIRAALPSAYPFYPLGLRCFGAPVYALGMDCGEKKYLAVWCTGEAQTVDIPLAGRGVCAAECLYPAGNTFPAVFHAATQTLSVQMEHNTARLFALC